MTIDYGRLAYQTIAAFGWDISWKHDKPVPDDAWPIDIINRHIAKAVAAERERIARRVSEHQILRFQVGRDPLVEVNEFIQDLAHDIATDWDDYE
jgi:hypothetical protein